MEAISTKGICENIDANYKDYMETLWKHSMACAYAAQITSESLDFSLSGDIFSMGLMHDIGKLILLKIILDLEKKGKFGDNIDRQTIFSAIDMHHNKFGATLLKRWEFSEVYQQISLYHDNLEHADPMTHELLIVHFANAMIKAIENPTRKADPTELSFVKSAQVMGLWIKLVEDVLEKVTQTISQGFSAFS